jgi:hypothetical protein
MYFGLFSVLRNVNEDQSFAELQLVYTVWIDQPSSSMHYLQALRMFSKFDEIVST